MIKMRFLAIFLLSMFAVGAQEHVALRILDINGASLANPAVGIPFLVEVQVTSQDTVPGTPQVAGLHNLVVEGKGHVSTINSVVNGVRSTRKIFQYRVHADNPGMYTLGPACINGKRRLQSNIVTIEVLKDQPVHKKMEPFLKLMLNKQTAVVGEPILCSLRFYPFNSVTLDGLSEPKFKDFSTTGLEGPYTGSEVVEGNNLTFIEWRTTLYPKKAGKLTIPSIAALYKKKRNQHVPHGFEMFDRLFNSGMEQKQIFSQAVSLDVQELPEHTGPVHGIGVYDSLTAEVDHAQAQEGEGIVYRLTLKGDGDLQSIQPLELTMQEGLKYYESKNFIDAAKKEKTFEYIVQGIKAGSWEIPPARFTYYDLQKRAYVTLESNPIIITINESAHQKDLYAEKQNKEGQKKDEESHVMLNEGPWYAHKERSLSWWLFWLLFFIPLVGIAYSLINRFIENYYTQHSAMFRKKKAFSHARAALKAAELSNNQQNLYTIFVQCFVDRCALVPSAVTVESIDSYLHQAGMPVEVRKQWQEFFDTIVQIKFFQGFKADIFKEAYTWLNQLENYI